MPAVARSSSAADDVSYICQNQSCRMPWLPSDVVIVNEGQGHFFRCPVCGARNKVADTAARGQAPRFEQNVR